MMERAMTLRGLFQGFSLMRRTSVFRCFLARGGGVFCGLVAPGDPLVFAGWHGFEVRSPPCSHCRSS